MPGSKRGSDATILGVNLDSGRQHLPNTWLARRLLDSERAAYAPEAPLGKLDDFHNVYAPGLRDLGTSIDVLVECYSSDREMEKLSAYEQELAQTLALAPDCRRAMISHHLAHLYSVFHPRGGLIFYRRAASTGADCKCQVLFLAERL